MDKKNWSILPIQKQGWPVPPEGKGSWTFKRVGSQNLMWSLFGNDNDGCEPHFHGEWWGFWKWWLRNRLHNFMWYVVGYAWWIEGDPYSSHNTSHLKYRILCGADPPDDGAPGWQIRLVRPGKRCWMYWRPFICHNGRLSAWVGWKRRGQLACSIKVAGTAIKIL